MGLLCKPDNICHHEASGDGEDQRYIHILHILKETPAAVLQDNSDHPELQLQLQHIHGDTSHSSVALHTVLGVTLGHMDMCEAHM